MDKTIKTNYTLLFALLVCNFYATAQIPFVHSSFNTDSTEYAYQFCESASGKHYLFAGYKANKDSSGFIFITDNSGNVLHSRYLNNEKTTNFSYIHYNTDHTFGLFSYKIDRDSILYACYTQIDTNLDILIEKETMMTDKKMYYNPLPYYSSAIQSQNVYSSLSYVITELDSTTPPPYLHKSYSVWLKQNLFGDTLKTFVANQFLAPGNPITSGIASNEILFLSRKITKMDTNFILIDTMDFLARNPPKEATTHDTVMPGMHINLLEVNPNIIFAGNTLFQIAPERPATGLLKYDMTTKRLSSIHSFPFFPDPYYFTVTSDYQSIIKHNNSIYTTSTLYNASFSVSKIVVAKHDTSGKCEWIRYFDTGNYIRSNSIFGTSDRGIIILGYARADAPTGKLSTDHYIIKLNEYGYPLSITNVSEQLRSGITVYPNPAQNEINIKGAAAGSAISISNIAGQTVLKEKIIGNAANSFSVGHLAAGTYIYTITDTKGQKTSSGKWIKQ